MRFNRILIIALFLFAGISAFAQNATIRGSIFDAANGESLPGVAIFIEGTTTGTTTDLDGKFNLNIEPGTYDLSISYISYETMKIEGVAVGAGEVKLLDDIMLKEQTFELAEVTITAQAVRNTETALATTSDSPMCDLSSSGSIPSIVVSSVSSPISWVAASSSAAPNSCADLV